VEDDESSVVLSKWIVLPVWHIAARWRVSIAHEGLILPYARTLH
jgi:hypothetical protein